MRRTAFERTLEHSRRPGHRVRRSATGLMLLLALVASGCSTRPLIVRSLADEVARQGPSNETDLGLAREASAVYLKIGESLLDAEPGHVGLAVAVASGFTQYAYAFVATEAERLESRDARAALALRERARALYRRALTHAQRALQIHSPGWLTALRDNAADGPARLTNELLPLAYWTAAAWGASIALSKDDPDAVADLPLAQRLANWAYRRQPQGLDGAIAALMGSFEAARPGGSEAATRGYFQEAERASGGRQASVWVAQAESVALPAGDRDGFEASLRRAIDTARRHPGLSNAVFRERAEWLLEHLDELF